MPSLHNYNGWSLKVFFPRPECSRCGHTCRRSRWRGACHQGWRPRCRQAPGGASVCGYTPHAPHPTDAQWSQTMRYGGEKSSEQHVQEWCCNKFNCSTPWEEVCQLDTTAPIKGNHLVITYFWPLCSPKQIESIFNCCVETLTYCLLVLNGGWNCQTVNSAVLTVEPLQHPLQKHLKSIQAGSAVTHSQPTAKDITVKSTSERPVLMPHLQSPSQAYYCRSHLIILCAAALRPLSVFYCWSGRTTTKSSGQRTCTCDENFSNTDLLGVANYYISLKLLKNALLIRKTLDIFLYLYSLRE